MSHLDDIYEIYEEDYHMETPSNNEWPGSKIYNIVNKFSYKNEIIRSYSDKYQAMSFIKEIETEKFYVPPPPPTKDETIEKLRKELKEVTDRNWDMRTQIANAVRSKDDHHRTAEKCCRRIAEATEELVEAHGEVDKLRRERNALQKQTDQREKEDKEKERRNRVGPQTFKEQVTQPRDVEI